MLNALSTTNSLPLTALVLVSALSTPSCFGDLSSLNEEPPDPFSKDTSGTTPSSSEEPGSNNVAGPTAPAPHADSSPSTDKSSSAPNEPGKQGDHDCAPTPETCNGIDDDCDGIIDNGCPAAVHWTNVLEQPILGDSPGGNHFSDQCATDEVLVGLQIAAERWVDQVQGICRKYAINLNTTTSEPAYHFEEIGQRALAPHPNASKTTHDLLCGPGEAVIGIRASQQNYWTAEGSHKVVIPRLWLRCATLSIQSEATTHRIQWHAARDIGPITGSYSDNTAWFAEENLPNPEVAVRLFGQAGSWLDRIGIGSTELRVALRLGAAQQAAHP